MSSSFFWDVTQYRLVIPYRRFGAAYRPHLQGSKSLVCSSVLTSRWALRCVSSAAARCFVQSAQQYAVLYIYDLLQHILTYVGLHIISNIYIYQEWRKAAWICGYGLCWSLVSPPVFLNRTVFCLFPEDACSALCCFVNAQFFVVTFHFSPFRLHASDVTLYLLSCFAFNRNFSRQLVMTSAPS